MPSRRVEVFGPAYLDRVLRVDRPLFEPVAGPSLRSEHRRRVEVRSGATDSMSSMPSGYSWRSSCPTIGRGRPGEIRLDRPLREGHSGRRRLRGLDWHDDLGGMGAGYAAALEGTWSARSGAEDDPASQAISQRLSQLGIAHRAIRVADRPADWTLLITSGEFGDKLPIGFRGCHQAVDPAALVALGGAILRASRGRVAAE